MAPADRPHATLSPSTLNRATLVRQGLHRREVADPVDVIGAMVGLQAQDPVSVHLALWNRIEGLDPDEVDEAFRSGDLVRCTLMRLTLHAVRRADHPLLSQAMQPTLRSRLGDPRYAGTGLTRTDFAEHEPELLEFLAIPRGADELESWFAARIADPEQVKGMVWAARSAGHVVRAPGEGPWGFGVKAIYQASPSRPRRDETDAADVALAQMIPRYLAAYGPATPKDIAQFALVPQARVRRALDLAGDAVVTRGGPVRQPLLDVPGATLPEPDLPLPPRLLGMWDNVLLAHADRSRIIPPALRRVVTRVNGDVLPTVLVDGRVAGVWRPTPDGIEVRLFPRPSSDETSRDEISKDETSSNETSSHEHNGVEPHVDEALARGTSATGLGVDSSVEDGLAAEAAKLWAYLNLRDSGVYRRHDHWWAKLPAGPTRLYR